jgi:hypothetical protein
MSSCHFVFQYQMYFLRFPAAFVMPQDKLASVLFHYVRHHAENFI